MNVTVDFVNGRRWRVLKISLPSGRLNRFRHWVLSCSSRQSRSFSSRRRLRRCVIIVQSKLLLKFIVFSNTIVVVIVVFPCWKLINNDKTIKEGRQRWRVKGRYCWWGVSDEFMSESVLRDSTTCLYLVHVWCTRYIITVYLLYLHISQFYSRPI